MRHHNPYEVILEELMLINDIHSDEGLQESLKHTQKHVIELRNAYRQCPSAVDYSNEHNKAAYLLVYYPHYIEPLYRVLDHLPDDILTQSFQSHKLTACFIGAGPAPETLGLLGYLDENEQALDSVLIYLLDTQVWRTGQELTRYHLAPKYWPNRRLGFMPLRFDLLNCNGFESELIEKAIKTSTIFVMQNCINDQLTQEHQLMDNLMWFFEEISTDSLFIIIDLKFPRVRDFMVRFENNIHREDIGDLLYSAANEAIEYRSMIPLPKVMQNLFTDEDGLIPRSWTRFYACAIKRKSIYDIDDIPF